MKNGSRILSCPMVSPRVEVYFKFRSPGLLQDVLYITFEEKISGVMGDYVGTVEYGRYDPVTRHFTRVDPTPVDLADAHAAIVTNDDDGFVWSDTWLTQ
jgi:hypothetical protein